MHVHMPSCSATGVRARAGAAVMQVLTSMLPEVLTCLGCLCLQASPSAM